MVLPRLRSYVHRSVLGIERLVLGTPLETPARALYRAVLKQSVDPSGSYSVTPQRSNFSEFQLTLPVDKQGLGRRARITGVYESHVMDTLDEVVDTETEFWEVGAQWGYFSMAVATRGKKVTAFEQNPTAAANLEKNAATNGFDHVSIIVGTVGEDVTLAEFEPPDVVLMDIEGYEESVLRAADRLLEAHPTLIIEMHEPSMLGTNAPENNPTTVIEYLKQKGYSVSMLGERSDENYHVLAVPTN